MGTYEDLKNAIADVIYTNGNNEITGIVLQQILQRIVTTIGMNATFAGIATPETDPGEIDQNVIYLASEPGIYDNFNGQEITSGIGIFSNKNGTWEYVNLGVYIQKQIDDIPIVKGDVENSAILKGEYEGYKNRAISQTSVALGAATEAGLKGWYYSEINLPARTITLSDKPTYILSGSTFIGGEWSSGIPNIEVGDIISIVNNSKYDLCSKVIRIDNNVITIDAFPFTSIEIDRGAAMAVMAGKFSDGYSIYIPDKPDAGIIDFGGGAFSEGGQSKATNICAHAEGLQTHAYGQFSHTEGRGTKAGYAAHAEGWDAMASGEDSHAEGYNTTASGKHSHAEGAHTIAESAASHAEGESTTASGNRSHAEGYNTTASGSQSHTEGNGTTASNNQAHAEGNATTASGKQSHAEGLRTIASGLRAHTEGQDTEAGGSESHAEGVSTKAIGDQSHAEGYATQAKGARTHTEGYGTEASGVNAHAEGYNTKATGGQSHAEGEATVAAGSDSHAEGYETRAWGAQSHSEGLRTHANNVGEHAEGAYNVSTEDLDQAKATRHSIGIGTSKDDRKNAIEVKGNGDIYIIGIGGYTGNNSDTAQPIQEVLASLL